MKFLVLGAGRMGRAIAFDLLQNDAVEIVTLADRSQTMLRGASEWLQTPRSAVRELELTDSPSLIGLMRETDIVISAAPYSLNLSLAEAALEAGVHFLDLGGNTDVVQQELELDDDFKRINRLLIPDCGLAPGLANILVASGVAQLDTIEEVTIRVGGLPLEPKPPLDYQLVFSVHGLLNEYSGKALILRNGNIKEVEALSDPEDVIFPDPFGRLEAFHTSGGTSTLPFTYRETISNLDYKTIRYPGHRDKMQLCQDLGLFSLAPLQLDGKDISPRDLLAEALQRVLPQEGPDVVLLRVRLTGCRNGKDWEHTFTVIDPADEKTGMTAMMRMTALPTSATAQLIGHGVIQAAGALPPEQAVPPDALLQALRQKGIVIEEQAGPREQGNEGRIP